MAVIVGAIILIVYLYNMNIKGLQDTEDSSIPMSTFVSATEWLSKNLSPNDIVIVPHPTVFYSLNPLLSSQYRDYKIIWDISKVILQANTTDDEVAKVRYALEAVIRYQPQLKYLIVEWFYPYANRIFTTQSCSDFGNLLHEVKRFDFQTPYAKWKNKLVICGINGKG